MNNYRPRHKSIALKGSPQMRVYRTFEDWQAEQKADVRTPEQRGIHVGSCVMWRYRANQVIVTERAIVVAIEDQMLTLLVKDIQERTCRARVSEIVDYHYGPRSLTQTPQPAFIASQMETPQEKNGGLAKEILRSVSPWQ